MQIYDNYLRNKSDKRDLHISPELFLFHKKMKKIAENFIQLKSTKRTSIGNTPQDTFLVRFLKTVHFQVRFTVNTNPQQKKWHTDFEFGIKKEIF